MSEKEITELEDLEPENGDEVKGGTLLETTSAAGKRVKRTLRDQGLDIDEVTRH